MYKTPGVQERLESTSAGRTVISVFLIATLVSLVVWNMPESEIQRRSLKVVRPYVTALSLEQDWGVFAPDPRREALDFFARVRFADGTEDVVRMPTGGSLVGAYWDYHWWKWVESVTNDQRDGLWEPAAVWLARRATTETRQPVEVTLVRRWQPIFPPGPGPSRGPWQEAEYYILQITPPNGAGE